jgi:hypothetical protein
LKAAGEHGVGVDIRQHDEAFFDENFGSLQGLDGVGQKVAGIGMDFEFDPVWHASGDGETGEAHSFLGVHGAASVGEQQDVVGDEVEDVRKRIVLTGEISAAEGDGDDLGARGDDGVAHEVTGGELAGAEHEPGLEGSAGDDEGCVGHEGQGVGR